ncbi:MAG TPA: hypothetical protein VIJ07_19075 [Dermatophilaceae bacterium]
MRRPLMLLLATTASLLSGVLPAFAMPDPLPTADPAPLQSYAAPSFARECHFLRYGEGAQPPASVASRDPLCVEYAKRDITVDNGGALRFLLAEPVRFGVAGQACRYWQIDHWSVQVDRANTAIVRWDGSYWFDRTDGTAASRLRNFSIDGEPVGVSQAAEAVRPLSPELADYLRRFGEGPNGGGGVRLSPPPSTLVCPRPTS